MKFKNFFKNTFPDLVAAILILLFVYASTSKLIDYEKFRIQLGKSPLLSPFASTLAWSVPLVEIIISILLATPKWRSWGLYASFGLMIVFTSYIFTITEFTNSVPCSCGGVLQHMSWHQHFIFNLCFVMLALIGVLLHNNNKTSLTMA